jgi:hypothetical protein
LILFVALFIVALLATRVVSTAGEPKTVTSLLAESGAYDFAYDRILESALSDLTERGLEFEGGPDGVTTIAFDDPERVTAALKAFIETVLPREYVQQKIDESLSEVVPYATGRTDSFVIDLETGDRIEAFPDALRAASSELSIGELVLRQVITPAVEQVSGEITGQALGISFTPEEAAEIAETLLPAEWIEQQLFSAADQVAPYLSGDSDTLEITINIKDRVPVAGQLLKEKLNDEDTLVTLVFDQFVNPNVAQIVQSSKQFSFGIEITDADVLEAVEIVAPEDWVRAQGDGLIDAIVGWLVGAQDELSYTLDFSERKQEAVDQLEALVFRKLDEQVAITPVCQTFEEGLNAANAALSGVFPSCLPQDSDLVLDQMKPLISNELRGFILDSIPDELTYSEAMFRGQMDADSLDALDSVRDRVINGFTFTDQDLLKMFSSDENGDGPSAGSIEALDKIRAGVRFDDTDITGRLEPDTLSRFDQYRSYIALGWNLRWAVFAPAFLFLIIAAFIGGRGWRGRMMWSAGGVTGAAMLFFIAVTAGWAASASYRQVDIGGGAISEERRAEMPAMSALLESGEINDLLERMATIWVQGLANSAIPWAVGGAVVFILAAMYPKYSASLSAVVRRGGGGGGLPVAALGFEPAPQPGDDALAEEDEAAAADPGDTEAA